MVEFVFVMLFMCNYVLIEGVLGVVKMLLVCMFGYVFGVLMGCV